MKIIRRCIVIIIDYPTTIQWSLHLPLPQKFIVPIKDSDVFSLSHPPQTRKLYIEVHWSNSFGFVKTIESADVKPGTCWVVPGLCMRIQLCLLLSGLLPLLHQFVIPMLLSHALYYRAEITNAINRRQHADKEKHF